MYMEEDNVVFSKSYDVECVDYPINQDAITIEDCTDLLKFKSQGVKLNDGKVCGFEGVLI